MLALSVLGPRGLVDLMVPGGATAEDVAVEYARQASLPGVPTLCTELGEQLPAGVPIGDADVEAGDVLVALLPGYAGWSTPRRRTAAERSSRETTSAARWWVAVAAAIAALAGWYAARQPDGTEQTLAVNVLLVAALLGVLPFGRHARTRSSAAPAFAAAAAYAVAWDPDPATLPITWGVAGLAAAATAAAGRALLPDADDPANDSALTESAQDEPHLVWMVSGIVLFAVAAIAVLFRTPPAVSWSMLLVASMLAARVAPMYAVDVPDQLLVDLERLAASAWSAREQPTGRRGRMVIARPMVARIVDRGQRIISAAAVAIAVVASSSSYLLLSGRLPSLDRLGAGLLAFFVGGGLLFAAGTYRNPVARVLLRLAGLACWLVLALGTVPGWSSTARAWVILAAVLLGLLCVVSGVATGRGWRSVWWARRAEVGEAICGAFAIASLSLSTGLFRVCWELTSR